MKLRLENYLKKLPRFTLEANFEVGAGERVALLGNSGSGKTTILRFITGLDLVAQGKLWYAEREVTELSPHKRDFGVCFQSPALFPSLTVLENVVVGLEARKVPKPERLQKGREWLERAKMSDLANHRVEKLSGGEAQRIALLRVLALQPRALLLDEPFSSLDSSLRKDARDWVLNLTQDLKVPLLFVTHDLADVEALATRVLEIQEIESGKRQVVASRSP